MSDLTGWLMVYAVNSVWQVAVLAACTAALARVAARGGARLQYRLWVGCLVLGVLLPALSAMGPVRLPEWPWRRAEPVRATRPVEARTVPGVGERIAVYTDAVVEPASRGGVGTVVAWVYGLTVALGLVRLGRRLRVTRAVVRGARCVELPPAMARALERAAQALNMPRALEVRPVAVYESARIPCPAAVSWPGPRLLVPEGFAAVPMDEAEAALAHELAHIRRRDFEVNLGLELLAMFAFYHPAMRWVKRRLAEAREAVCDEMAAEVTAGRTAYARSLLRLAGGVRGSSRGELMLGLFEGTSLEGRILRLVDGRPVLSRTYRLMSAAGCWLVLAGLGLGVVAIGARPVTVYGQILHATGPLPSFEVATIKPSKAGETRSAMGFSAGGRGFTTTNATVRDLIQEAYNIKSTDQIADASGWMVTEKFDIEARMNDSQAASLAKLPMEERIGQVRLMLQSLLAERFALKLSESSRESRYFALVTAKGGPKLKPTKMTPADPNGINSPHPVIGPRLVRKGPGRVEVTGGSIGLLTDMLSRQPELGAGGGFTLGELVVDKTGLRGAYDWTLTWTPDLVRQAGTTESANAPSLFTALQEQLGLKLERSKGTVDVLVIDHVERPSAN